MLGKIRTALGYDNPTPAQRSLYSPFSEGTSDHKITKLVEHETGYESPTGTTYTTTTVWHITYKTYNPYREKFFDNHFYYVSRVTSYYDGEGAVFEENYEINPGIRGELTQEQINAVVLTVSTDCVPKQRGGREA